jgi:hypothetical protein
VECGAPLHASEPAELKSGNIWVRRPGDFALRVDVGDLRGVLKRGIAIEEGTRGLLFQQGQLVGTLTPGQHTLQTVTERLKALVIDSPCEVVLVDVGDAELMLDIPDLQTSEKLPVGAKVKVVAGLDAPLDFYVNLMRSQSRITTAELSNRVRQQAVGVLQQGVADCSRDELYGNLELAERIEDELREALARSFGRMGLEFQHVEFVEFAGEDYDKIRQDQGGLAAREANLELERQRRVVEHKFEELLTEDRMRDIQSEADFQQFLKQVEHEAGVKDLLRTQEREELQRQYFENKEDHALAREHLLATLRWQRKRERLEHEMTYKRQLVENKGELSEMQRTQRLDALDREQRAKIERDEREHRSRLERIDHEHEQRIQQKRDEADLEHEQDRREADLAMDLLKQTKQLKREDADADVDRELRRQRGEQEIRTEAEEAVHRRELERLEQLSSMTHEALIAASPAEQSKMLAELRRTEMLKDMTDDQILAAAAEKSPDVARAFAEKFSSAKTVESKKEMQSLYERMLEQQTSAGDSRAADQQKSMDMMKELMETALKTQRDTSVATAQGPQTPGPSVVYPPPGSGAATVVGSQQPPSGTQTVDCPQCRSQSPQGSQFCGNCGFRFV